MIKVEEIAEKYKGYEVDEEKLKEFLILPKPRTVWDLKVGNKYYFIDDTLYVIESTWVNETIDINRRNVGNCFLTREEAEFEVERRKVEVIFLKYGRREFLCNRDNWLLSYYGDINKFDIDSYSSLASQGTIYFDTKKLLVQAIKETGEDNIKKYIFGVNN